MTTRHSFGLAHDVTRGAGTGRRLTRTAISTIAAVALLPLLSMPASAVASSNTTADCGTAFSAGKSTCLSTASPAGLNPDGSVGGLYPADIQSAYGLSGGVAGNTVGILIAHANPTLEADLAHYRSLFGLPACTVANGCLTIVNQYGATGARPSYDAGWGEEESLDVDAVSAAYPAGRILVVEASSNNSNDLDSAADTAVSLGATVISASYGALEDGSWSSEAVHYTHPGVPTFAANGDGGDARALYPAALPGVIAVAGTKLNAVDPFEPHATGWVHDTAGATSASAVPRAAPSAGGMAPLSTADDAARVTVLTTALARARAAESTAANRLSSARLAATRAKQAAKRAHTRTAKRAAAAKVTSADRTVAARRRTASAAAAHTSSVRISLHAAERALEADQNSGTTAAGNPVLPAPPATLPRPSSGGGSGTVPAPLPPVTPVPPVVIPAPTPTPTPTSGFAGFTETAWSTGEGGCSTFTPAHSWAPSIGCGSYRTAADIAAVAGSAFAIYNSSDGGWLRVGGTSLATPIVAAIAARSGHAQALAADALNGQGGGATLARAAAAGNLNDITTGSVGTCWMLTSCAATTGYDASTGFGSPKGLTSFTW